MVYVLHPVWVGGAKQTARAIPDGRQLVFLLRVSSDELANTAAFQLKISLRMALKNVLMEMKK